MDEGLRAIYGHEPDDLHIVTNGGSRLTFFLTRAVAALAVLAVLVLGAFYLASKGILFNQQFTPLALAVEAPKTLKSGEATTITIPYENPQNVPIASLSVNVNVPPGFKVTKTDPIPSDPAEMIFTIGSVAPHAKGAITLQGIWLTETPSTSSIQAIASYKPANFDSDFSQIASANVQTDASVLTLTMDGPQTASPGGAVTYNMTLTNTGSVAVSQASLDLTMPLGFAITKSSPAFAPGELPKWTFDTLAPASVTKVSVTGVFASDVSGSSAVSAAVSLAAAGKTGESVQFLSQAEAHTATDVSGGNIRLSLVGNGLSGDVTVEPGKNLSVGVQIQNTGTAAITDASIILDFQPDKGVPIVWSKALLDGGVLAADGVHFDVKTIGALNPNDKKTFNLSFPVKTDFVAGDVQAFTVVAKATSGGSTVLSSPLNVKTSASVTFSATAHYYSTDGAPIGSGPLPPVVGQETSYEVMWSVTHALHPLENLTVTATLPAGVTYGGNQAADAGAIIYDDNTRTVRWDVAALTAGSAVVHGKFYVKVTPEAADAGQLKKILSGSSLRVTDSDTGARIDRDADPLTTDLPDDKFAAGKGIVTN